MIVKLFKTKTPLLSIYFLTLRYFKKLLGVASNISTTTIPSKSNKQNIHKQKLSAKPTNKTIGSLCTIRKYLSHVKILTNWRSNSSWRRVVPDPDLKPLNTNRQSLAVFVLCFKIHALLLSNSRAAVLETAFFVHGNCCQLFHNFFSIKLGIYCCRQTDVNNFVCTTWGVSAVQSVEIDHRQSSPWFRVAFTNYFVS